MPNKKVIIAFLSALTIVVVLVFLSRFTGIGQKRIPSGTVVNLLTGAPAPENTEPVAYKITEVVNGLDVPWSIVFTSNNRILVTERSGSIREVVNGSLNPNALIVFPEAQEVAESGLMGMALHPNYETNKYVYVCMTYQGNDGLADKVERFVDNGASLSRDRVILGSFPAARFHAGCRIKFGPDGKLYVTTGDATVKQAAQNMNSLSGKILRMNDDGSVPSDNPFAGSLVWSLGHRNPQGIAWHPESAVLYETEHGPSGNDGPGGGDEVNIIKPGLNYGWPVVSHERAQSGMESPKLVFTPAEAPSGATFYSGKIFPQFKNNFFFTALRGQGVFRVVISETNHEEIVSYEKMDISFGRIRDIVEGPDGLIYFSTSNRDGRGSPRDGDDKIYRLEPK